MPIPTEELTKLGEALGATKPDDTKVSIRFNPTPPYNVPKGWSFLHFTETPAQTPTGGKYIRRTLVVKRNKDGQKFVGNLRKDHKGNAAVNLKPYTDKRNAEEEATS